MVLTGIRLENAICPSPLKKVGFLLLLLLKFLGLSPGVQPCRRMGAKTACRPWKTGPSPLHEEEGSRGSILLFFELIYTFQKGAVLPRGTAGRLYIMPQNRITGLYAQRMTYEVSEAPTLTPRGQLWDITFDKNNKDQITKNSNDTSTFLFTWKHLCLQMTFGIWMKNSNSPIFYANKYLLCVYCN